MVVFAAYDIGGVSREFFTVITSSLFDASHGYFEQFKDDKQALVCREHFCVSHFPILLIAS
jgi:hypothetical protein